MNDDELERLYQSKGKKSEDISRIKKLVAISHLKRVQPARGLFSFGYKCPGCNSELDKKNIQLSKDESVVYYSCSNLECSFEYAKKIEKQIWGFNF